MMFSTYEECSKKIKEILNQMALYDKPYIFEGKAQYGGYWREENQRPYLSDFTTSNYDKGFSANACIKLIFNGEEVKNFVKISFDELDGKYRLSVAFNLDKEIIKDKNRIQMALFTCDLNNCDYLKNVYNPFVSFEYNYASQYAYIASKKEFNSISEEYIEMFLNNALSYDFLFNRQSWIQYLYGWLSDIDNEDYYMLDETFDIDDVLRENIEIQKSIETIQYDL